MPILEAAAERQRWRCMPALPLQILQAAVQGRAALSAGVDRRREGALLQLLLLLLRLQPVPLHCTACLLHS